MRFFSAVFELFGSVLGVIFYLFLAVGSLYWLWIAIQIGSFWMFILGLFPPTAIFLAMPVGAWSLAFGVPDWVVNIFG